MSIEVGEAIERGARGPLPMQMARAVVAVPRLPWICIGAPMEQAGDTAPSPPTMDEMPAEVRSEKGGEQEPEPMFHFDRMDVGVV